MKRFLAATLFGLLTMASWAAESETMPWPDGEALKYDIQWGVIPAAEAAFTAKNGGNHWEFRLHLTSKGAVDTFYPINSWFWSFQQKQPWRSIEYGEDRSEGKKRIKERTTIDYETKLALREKWTKAETDRVPFTEYALDDLGSMLYGLRRGEWKVGDSRPIVVCEGSKIKTGMATCKAIEKKVIDSWPEQQVILLECVPTAETAKKQKGHLSLWMTADSRRLPLRANLSFKYGTFEITLRKE